MPRPNDVEFFASSCDYSNNIKYLFTFLVTQSNLITPKVNYLERISR